MANSIKWRGLTLVWDEQGCNYHPEGSLPGTFMIQAWLSPEGSWAAEVGLGMYEGGDSEGTPHEALEAALRGHLEQWGHYEELGPVLAEFAALLGLGP
jgi:hypothetical protein